MRGLTSGEDPDPFLNVHGVGYRLVTDPDGVRAGVDGYGARYRQPPVRSLPSAPVWR